MFADNQVRTRRRAGRGRQHVGGGFIRNRQPNRVGELNPAVQRLEIRFNTDRERSLLRRRILDVRQDDLIGLAIGVELRRGDDIDVWPLRRLRRPIEACRHERDISTTGIRVGHLNLVQPLRIAVIEIRQREL